MISRLHGKVHGLLPVRRIQGANLRAGLCPAAFLVFLPLVLSTCGPPPVSQNNPCGPITKNPQATPISPNDPAAQFPTGFGTPPAVPVPTNGRLLLREENVNQHIPVAPGTVIEVELVNGPYGPWTVPMSSDPTLLPRLSASSRCVTPITAAFRAIGSGHIDATRGNLEITQKYVVFIQVNR